jgi:putative flippase GtrA
MILPSKATTFSQRRGVRQFIKFGIVGASSAVINFLCVNLLYRVAGLSLVPSLSIAFLMSAMNGFFWNRHWTFKEARGKPAHTQSLQFLIVNIIGWLLNTSIVVLIIAHFTSGGQGVFGSEHQLHQIVLAIVAGEGKKQYSFWLLNGALAIATAVVVFWNFFANRLWTFKH